jgi:hypothetical protein
MIDLQRSFIQKVSYWRLGQFYAAPRDAARVLKSLAEAGRQRPCWAISIRQRVSLRLSEPVFCCLECLKKKLFLDGPATALLRG